jgi:hypothetical protein
MAKGKTPTTTAEKKFANLAAPKNVITFADKIAGATMKKGGSVKMKMGGSCGMKKGGSVKSKK